MSLDAEDNVLEVKHNGCRKSICKLLRVRHAVFLCGFEILDLPITHAQKKKEAALLCM